MLAGKSLVFLRYLNARALSGFSRASMGIAFEFNKSLNKSTNIS